MDAAAVRIETDRLILRLPAPSEAERALGFYQQNFDHLDRWTSPWPDGHFTADYWVRQLARNRQDLEADRSCRMFAFDQGDDDGPAVGICNFSNFVRGRFQACHLGYAIAEDREGKGLMREAVEAAVAFAFAPEGLNLHRVMANFRTDNPRSGHLLERLGFVVEGTAKDYLYLDGAWRDHVLTALVNPKPVAPRL